MNVILRLHPEAPEWAREIIFTRTQINFSKWDRIKILFGAKVTAEGKTFCEYEPGKTQANGDVRVNFPKRQNPGPPQGQEEKKHACGCVGNCIGHNEQAKP